MRGKKQRYESAREFKKKNLENRERQRRRQDGGKGWGSRWEGEKSV